VIDAVRRLTSPEGLGIAERRITISTCGLADRIRRLSTEGLKIGLAISLNATTDADRSRTMPVTRKHGIDELLDAAREWATATGRRVTFEYVLLRGENDREEDVTRLRAISRRVPCKINVIPLNPFPGVAHARPDTTWVETFIERLMRSPSPSVTQRMTRGMDIAAACGQLAVFS
jgi:23S rRNA (adenine2503-C2)-methyltransferase